MSRKVKDPSPPKPPTTPKPEKGERDRVDILLELEREFMKK